MRAGAAREDGRRLGYISIQAFGASTAADARGALAALEARRVSGYVLDLRSNGGGLVSAGAVHSAVIKLLCLAQRAVSLHEHRGRLILQASGCGQGPATTALAW
jgi:C-terminal processing protease CtpA/Prc